MLAFLDIPTPTPPPSQILSEGINAIRDSQKLAETVANLSALGILGLGIVAVILWIVLSRGRGREAQTLINALAQQNAETRKTFEGIVDDLRGQLGEMRSEVNANRKQIEKQHEDYRLENFKRDDRYLETITAFTESNHRLADIADALKQNEARQDQTLETIKADVTKALTDGTPIAIRTESAANEILQHVRLIFQRVNENGELLKMIAPLLEVRDIALEVKRKTGPIPKVEVTPEAAP